MSHDLELVNGKPASFASRREPAWHGLGTIVNTDNATWQELAEPAGLLNWNVRKVRVADIIGSHYNFGKEDPHYVVRDNPYGTGQIDILGTVSGRYQVFSNESTLEFADTLVNGSDIVEDSIFGKRSWETLGAIDEGRKIFGSIAIEREIVLDEQGANDVVKIYLLVANSHDGTRKLTVLITPVRVVCQNTLNFALSGAKQSFMIKHTGSMNGRVDEARNTLQITDKYIQRFEEESRKLFETPVSDQKFFEIVKAFHGNEPEESNKRGVTVWNQKVEQAMSLWRGETQANIAGTAWAAVNALTEQAQWFRGIRKGESENFYQVGAGFDKNANDSRNEILSTVKKLITV